MFCHHCRADMPKVDQSMASCGYCDADLSDALNGVTVCKACADQRLICQGCGQELRLGDFQGVFVSGANMRLARPDERKIVKVLLEHTNKLRKQGV